MRVLTYDRRGAVLEHEGALKKRVTRVVACPIQCQQPTLSTVGQRLEAGVKVKRCTYAFAIEIFQSVMEHIPTVQF